MTSDSGLIVSEKVRYIVSVLKLISKESSSGGVLSSV